MPLPPGPPLPALAQTALFVTRPVEFLEYCHRRYGDCFTVDTIIFGREIEIVHPDLIRRIFTGDPDVLRAGEANSILGPLLGPRSVLLLDGAEHARQRKLLMPPFHGERMVSYAQTMLEITDRVAESWLKGQRFSLHPHMQRITLEIILRTVFGLEEGSHLDDLHEALTHILDQQSKPVTAFFTSPPLRRSFFGLTPWDKFLLAVQRADDLIYRQIRRRRAEAKGAAAHDVLAMLLDARDEQGNGMTDGELRDELMTLLVAGHETTATMLCWAFDMILGDARVRARLLAELDGARAAESDPDFGAIARLPYLDATIKEVLRLRPVIPAVGRRTKAPLSIGGYDIPAGELLVPVSLLTHRLPAFYPDPETFKPERFIDTKPDPYAWFPFGGGARRCLGMAFSLYEMKIVLARVLSRVALRKRTQKAATVALRGFTVVPKGGTEVIVDGPRERGVPRSSRVAHGASEADGVVATLL
jgi:cytochrome P450